MRKVQRLAISLTCLLPLTAQAIVNIENMRDKQSNKGLNGAVNASISGASGNTDKTVASLGGRLVWQQKKASTLLITRISYGENSGIRDTNKSFLHLRHIVEKNDQYAQESFTQIEQNEFSRLDFRGLIGAGLRKNLKQSDSGYLAAGLGAFYSSETLSPRSGLTDDGTEKLSRLNSYLAFNYQLSPQTSISSTTYYQPAFKEVKDFRLLEQASLKVKLSDVLHLKITLDIAHDNQPPQAVEKTDTSYRTGIEYNF